MPKLNCRLHVQPEGIEAQALMIAAMIRRTGNNMDRAFEAVTQGSEIVVETLREVIAVQAKAAHKNKKDMAALAAIVEQHAAEETKAGKARIASTLVDAVTSILEEEEEK